MCEMNISFEIPRDIEQELRSDGLDVSREAKEAYLVSLYRQERITHHQLSEALGLSRYETDGVLKRHKVWLELTPEELAAQAASLRDVRPE
jgi:predicted HTH domain antitoxin